MKIKPSQSKTATGPSKGKFVVLRQICNLIPPFLVSKLARETGVEMRARTYSPWSHVVTLLYAQLVHAIGLNDVCDSLRLHCGLLVGLRGATPPSRNNLSHAVTVSAGDAGTCVTVIFWPILPDRRHQAASPSGSGWSGLSEIDGPPALISEGQKSHAAGGLQSIRRPAREWHMNCDGKNKRRISLYKFWLSIPTCFRRYSE